MAITMDSDGVVRAASGARRGGPVLDRAVKGLRQVLLSRRLVAGDFLPSERALAGELDVARGTVRVALQNLVSEGVVTEVRGRYQVAKTGAGASLMANTICILTTWAEQPLNSTGGIGGWERYVAIGAADAIRAAGLHALALYPDRLAGDDIRHLLQDLPRGVVVSTRAQASETGRRILDALHGAGANVVVYGDAPEVAGFARVASDHAAGAYQLARWLMAQGRRRILRVWPLPLPGPVPYWLRGRDAGYERALREAGLEALPSVCVPEIVVPDNDEQHFHANVRLMAGHLLEHLQGARPVDALMADTDGRTFVCAAACRLLGRSVHEEVTITGYDNYWQESPLRQLESAVPAATVDKLNRKIGQELVQVLLARDKADGQANTAPHFVNPELVVIPENGKGRINGAADAQAG